ncbi:MAG: ABC transporter permease [Candidatus Bathyarchaeota archaeon]|nr:ABC transporter permease [Candidatus Bathyarchaeota archaeon]
MKINIKRVFSNLLQISKKDLLEFRRDRIRLITFIIMPFFMMILTGFIYPNQSSLRDIPIGIADQDKGEMGQGIIEAVENLSMSNSSPAFNVKAYNDIDEIKDAIKRQEINGGLIIPSSLSSKISSNQQAELTIIEDQSSPQIGALMTQVMGKLIDNFGQQIAIQKLTILLGSQSLEGTPRSDTSSPIAFIQPIASKIEGLISGEQNYFQFVAPGIIAMIVMTAVLTGLAASVSRENEQGTLDGIIVAPVSRLAIILGKAVAQSIRGLVQGIIVMIITVLIFDVTIHGNFFLIIFLLIFGIFSFVGLGILVSAFASEQETATQLLFMLQFPMLFLSGVFFPIQQMPDFMQKISALLPLTYAVEALRKIMILGAGIQEISSELIILFAFGVITLAITVPLFRKMIAR